MKRILLLTLSAIVLATCASQNTRKAATATAVPTIASYASDAKTIPVGAIPSAVLHDSVRNKDLELSIEYPTKDGPYPVVIFSPEYGASNMSYVGVSSYWASHGYVVMKPKHADAGALGSADEKPMDIHGQPEGRRGRRGEQERNPNQPQQPRVFRVTPAEQWEKQTAADWQNRVADIRFIIDSLPRLVDQYPELKPRLDATKIGIGGHSYGAFTALLAGGMRTFSTAGAPTAYVDPRVKAVVAMSPQGPGVHQLTNQSWADLRLPVLFITGSQDFGANENENAAWRRQAFELSPAGDKWFVSLNGAGHAAFTGRAADLTPYYEPTRPPDYYPGARPPGAPVNPSYVPPPQDTRGRGAVSFGQQNLFNTVRTVSLAFWDAYLKNVPAGHDYLSKLKNRGDAEVVSK